MQLDEKKELNYKRLSAIVFSLLFSFLLVGFILLVGGSWETDDDPAISLLLSMKGNNYSPFQWRLLSVALSALYTHVPVIDWWAVNTVFAICIGFFACVYVIFMRYSKWQASMLSVTIIALVWLTAAYSMNFTRTATVVAVGGCTLLADSILKKIQNSPIEFGFGCLLLLYGASIRSESAMIALAFLAVVGGIKLLTWRFSLNFEWFKQHARYIVGLVLVAVIFFFACGVDYLLLNEEQREYIEYNSLRAEIQDYPHMFPSYDSASKEYAATGMDKYDIDLLLRWFSEETEIMNVGAMQKLASVRNRIGSLSGLTECAKSNKFQLLVAGIVIIMLLLTRKRTVPIGLILAFSVLCGLVLALNGRIPPRVLSSLILTGVVACVFLCGEDKYLCSNEKPADDVFVCGVKKRIISGAISAVSVFACVSIIIGPVISNWRSINHPWIKDDMTEYRAQLLDEINADSENVYIYDLYSCPASIGYSFSFWESKPTEYCKNYFALGGWDARHPYKTKLLSEYGITNPVRALFENTNVYSTFSYRLFEYLRVRYNYRISVCEVKSIGNTAFVQYTAPIDDEKISQGNQLAQIQEFYHCYRGLGDSWYLLVNTNDELDLSDRVYYCNITVADERYTFRLHCDGESLSGYLYGIGTDYDVTSADISIFYMESNGQYTQYVLE